MRTDLEKSSPVEGAEFERWLLDSARNDELPPVAPAFDKFSATLGLLALQAAPMPPPVPTGVGNARGRALKWLSVGAIGGSALTALWLGIARPPPQSAHLAEPSATVVSTAAATQVPTATPQPAPHSSNEFEGPAPSKPRALRIDAQHRSPASKSLPAPLGPTPRSAAGSATPSATPSTLLAEVALLDAVRAKLSRSDTPGALHLLQSYERKFPQGQLASDAAVLSIEALRAAGNRSEAQRRAAAFLERAPDDPHAARVRSLAAE